MYVQASPQHYVVWYGMTESAGLHSLQMQDQSKVYREPDLKKILEIEALKLPKESMLEVRPNNKKAGEVLQKTFDGKAKLTLAERTIVLSGASR